MKVKPNFSEFTNIKSSNIPTVKVESKANIIIPTFQKTTSDFDQKKGRPLSNDLSILGRHISDNSKGEDEFQGNLFPKNLLNHVRATSTIKTTTLSSTTIPPVQTQGVEFTNNEDKTHGQELFPAFVEKLVDNSIASTKKPTSTDTSKKEKIVPAFHEKKVVNQKRRKPINANFDKIETSESDKVLRIPQQPIRPAFRISPLKNKPLKESRLAELPRSNHLETKLDDLPLKFKEINAKTIGKSNKNVEFVPGNQELNQRKSDEVIKKDISINLDSQTILTTQRPTTAGKIIRGSPFNSLQTAIKNKSVQEEIFPAFKLPDFFSVPFFASNVPSQSQERARSNSIFNSIGQPTGQIGVVSGHPQTQNFNLRTGSYSYVVGL